MRAVFLLSLRAISSNKPLDAYAHFPEARLSKTSWNSAVEGIAIALLRSVFSTDGFSILLITSTIEFGTSPNHVSRTAITLSLAFSTIPSSFASLSILVTYRILSASS